jgi:hypothetical protein
VKKEFNQNLIILLLTVKIFVSFLVVINFKNMNLTQQDIYAIEEVVKKHVGKAKNELLEEIHKVGVEVVENKTIILQHIQNSPAWKH